MMARKDVARFGRRGKHLVRVFLETGGELIRVQWSEGARVKTESWPKGAKGRVEAVAFAEGLYERLTRRETAAMPRRTLGELWNAYRLAEWDHLRPRTRALNEARWAKFCPTYLNPDTPTDRVTRETLDAYRKRMRTIGHVGEQVKRHLDLVRAVFRFAVERELIPATGVIAYRFKRAKDETITEIPEYSPSEAAAILAQFDPRDTREWRAYVALHLFAFAGPRQNAARHLTWDDIDFDASTIRWAARWDKMGTERVQPAPVPLIGALWVAYGWRLAFGYDGPLVLFAPGKGVRDPSNEWARSARRAASNAAKADEPYTYSAFNARLREAEAAAGVPHVKYRAAHGFRRYVVNEVLELTGDLVLAGQFVGDRDLRTLRKHYVKDRPERLARVAGLMSEARTTTTTESAE